MCASTDGIPKGLKATVKSVWDGLDPAEKFALRMAAETPGASLRPLICWPKARPLVVNTSREYARGIRSRQGLRRADWILAAAAEAEEYAEVSVAIQGDSGPDHVRDVLRDLLRGVGRDGPPAEERQGWASKAETYRALIGRCLVAPSPDTKRDEGVKP